jgi:hypothetical protein
MQAEGAAAAQDHPFFAQSPNLPSVAPLSRPR